MKKPITKYYFLRIIFLFNKYILSRFNNYSPTSIVSKKLIESFRKEKPKKKEFGWVLHDTDLRDSKYQYYSEESINNFMYWLKPHHIKFRDKDFLSKSFDTKEFLKLGNKIWRNFFKSYKFNTHSYYDEYSIPDIYYSTNKFKKKPKFVLDIGGGWGRMAFAWAHQKVTNITIIDSIEQPYFHQYLYVSKITEYKVNEYFINRSFDVDKNIINHLPLWMSSKIPNNTYDIITCIQVLRETSNETVNYILNEVTRVLKSGGYFYLRDNDLTWEDMHDCMHDYNIHEEILNRGFKYQGFNNTMIYCHGIPRIYIKI